MGGGFLKIRLRTLIIAWVAVIAALLYLTFADAAIKPKLTGGTSYTKSMSLWQLQRFKTVTLMRREPMRWCPFKAYLAFDRYIRIGMADNRYFMSVDADVESLLASDAAYNKRFATDFPTSGSRNEQIQQIYDYCAATKYVAHVNTAREVFTTRKGDCAGISAAFYVLCKAKNIPVRYVIGWTKEGMHAWNRVRMKDGWYWIDCTRGIWLLTKKQYSGRTVMEYW